MSSESKISIIIPVYNGENYIKNTVDNILKNSYKNIEIILINDGSIDKSWEIIQNIEKNDKRVKAINKPNEGISKTRQVGIENATGEYICFCDQDDVVPSNAYEVMLKNMKEKDIDICIGSSKSLLNESLIDNYTIKSNYYLAGDDIDKYILTLIKKWLSVSYSCKDDISWSIWNCMYKKRIIDQNNIAFRHFVGYEDDFLFNLDYIKNCKKIFFIKDVTYIWKINYMSESHTKNKVFIENYHEKYGKCLEYIKNEIVKNIHSISKQQIYNLFDRSLIIKTILNYSKVGNKDSNKDNLNKIIEIFDDKIFKEKNEFIFIKINGINNFLLENGHYKMAYYIDKYLYYKLYK